MYVYYGCGGNSAVQSHSMGGVMGGRGEGHTHTRTHTHTHRNTHRKRTREWCTYPLATYPLKSAQKVLEPHFLQFGLPELTPGSSLRLKNGRQIATKLEGR